MAENEFLLPLWDEPMPGAKHYRAPDHGRHIKQSLAVLARVRNAIVCTAKLSERALGLDCAR